TIAVLLRCEKLPSFALADKYFDCEIQAYRDSPSATVKAKVLADDLLELRGRSELEQQDSQCFFRRYDKNQDGRLTQNESRTRM
ncbi:MAG: hypothetical protein ACPHJ3_19875, partial [Rubripirellula sp.]